MQEHYDYGVSIKNMRDRMRLRYMQNSLGGVLPISLKSIAVDTPFKEIAEKFQVAGISIGCTPITSPFGAIDALGVLEYALYGLAADYAFVDYKSNTPPCGTGGCQKFGTKPSATLCGHCIDVSDLGNIMFGLGGAVRGYNFPFSYVSAGSYNVLADWLPSKNKNLLGLLNAFFSPDGRAAMIGWTVGNTQTFRNEATFCAMYSAGRVITGGYENGDPASQCVTCQKEYSPEVLRPSSLWRISGQFPNEDTISQLQRRILKALGK
jgi:hypothetical protein